MPRALVSATTSGRESRMRRERHMGTTTIGSRRAVLKASVAIAAFAGAGGLISACSESKTPDAGATAVPADPVVQTKYGKVKGFVEDGVSVFKGVRYGADTSTTRFQ